MAMKHSPNDKVLQDALTQAEQCVSRGVPLPADLWSTLLAYGVDTSFYGGMLCQQEIDFDDAADEWDSLTLDEQAEMIEDLDNQEYTDAMAEEDERLADGLT